MSRYEKDFVRNFLGIHRQMEHFLNDVFRCGRSAFTEKLSWSPLVDVFETADCYVVKVELAGVDRDDIRMTFEDGELTLEGCRHDRFPETKLSCHQMEIPYGRFRRTIHVSQNIDDDRITAGYHAGFLEICLPRSDAGTHKRVRIEVE